MGKHPDLSQLQNLFERGEEFSLTDAQYERKTGAPLPKAKNYILNNSALARKAAEYDYYLEVIQKTVILKKKKTN